jgi:hypothetical protein
MAVAAFMFAGGPAVLPGIVGFLVVSSSRTTRAAIYAHVSKDDDLERLWVQRQQSETCREGRAPPRSRGHAGEDKFQSTPSQVGGYGYVSQRL